MRIKSMVVSSVLLLGAGVAAISQARTVSGMGGMPQRPADATCFTNASGLLFNSCSTTRQYCYALSNDGAGTVGIQVNGTVSGSGSDLTCSAQAIDANGTVVATAANRSLPGSGTGTIYLDSLWVPGWGASYVCCNMAPGARINTVTW